MKKLITLEESNSLYIDKKSPQYFQVAMFWGDARKNLPNFLRGFYLHVFRKFLPPDAIALIGAGQFFQPFKINEIACQSLCLYRCPEVIKNYRQFHKASDLSLFVEFLRSGGAEHGCPTKTI